VVALYKGWQHTTAELANIFKIARSRVYWELCGPTGGQVPAAFQAGFLGPAPREPKAGGQCDVVVANHQAGGAGVSFPGATCGSSIGRSGRRTALTPAF
jgi:hypothetical protein